MYLQHLEISSPFLLIDSGSYCPLCCTPSRIIPPSLSNMSTAISIAACSSPTSPHRNDLVQEKPPSPLKVPVTQGKGSSLSHSHSRSHTFNSASLPVPSSARVAEKTKHGG